MSELDSPLLRAVFLLAKEFGWTPQQVQQMTMAQIGFYLDSIAHDKNAK
jgi:hypothetical protein